MRGRGEGERETVIEEGKEGKVSGKKENMKV